MSNEKRTFYPVTGRSDSGIVAPRYPIQILQATKPEQFSLFILSYLIIQDRKGSLAPTPVPIPPGTGVAAGAFFNISAIHGKPYERWPGDDKDYPSDYHPNRTTDLNRFGGYCNHGSVLFPTWHRPYVLLIEQSIGEQATALAKEFDKLEGNNSAKWQQAAKELRFPYWDWASPETETLGLPPVLYEPKVPVMVPGKVQLVLVDNPITYFPLSVIPSDFADEQDGENVTSYFREWKTTLRHPRPNQSETRSHIDELQRELKGRARDLRTKVSALFTFGPNMDPNRAWDEFSNHSPATISKGSRTYHGSIEGVHDSIHDIIGGLGHMAFPDYAGFDPIFFLHHSNVDRLYALWEYCYRNENREVGYWMGDGYTAPSGRGLVPWMQPGGTYSELDNGQVTENSGLAPFRTAEGEYWTSLQARYFDDKAFKKYYTYETAGIRVDAPATAAERLAARKRLQAYYSYLPIPKKIPGGIFLALPGDMPEDHEIIPGHRQFNVAVELLEHAFNGPYTFKLFRKATEPELIGAVSVFTRPGSSPCAGCQGRREAGAVVHGVIFIDEALVGELIADQNVDTNSLDEVAKALKEVLYAELQNPGGVTMSVVGPEGLVGAPREGTIAPISVQLFSSAAARPKDDEDAPVHWVDWKEHGDVFHGQVWTKPQA